MAVDTLEDKLDLADSLSDFESYNPLEFIEGEDDEDWLDDDGLLLPESKAPEVIPKPSISVYSPDFAGSVEQAVRDLVGINAARRPILLSILDWSREGIAASELFDRIECAQAENRSVYEPVSYCRMLERAGALSLQLTEDSLDEDTSVADAALGAAEELNDATITYLSIEEEVDPIWHTTPEGLAVYEELIQGNEWRNKIFGEDSMYAEVYLAVMDALQDGGKQKGELAALAETFSVTKEPLKLGTYFIDVLEATSAIHWKHSAWNLTELGQSLVEELRDYCAQSFLATPSLEMEV